MNSFLRRVLVALAGIVGLATVADASPVRDTVGPSGDFARRAAVVRERLERLGPRTDTLDVEVDSPVDRVQWLNFPNWPNWNNWGNGWLKFPNWGNIR